NREFGGQRLALPCGVPVVARAVARDPGAGHAEDVEIRDLVSRRLAQPMQNDPIARTRALDGWSRLVQAGAKSLQPVKRRRAAVGLPRALHVLRKGGPLR